MRRALGCIVVFLTLGLFTASVTPAAEPELVLKGATAWKTKQSSPTAGFWEFHASGRRRGPAVR